MQPAPGNEFEVDPSVEAEISEVSEADLEEIQVHVRGIHGEEVAELSMPGDSTILATKVALSSKCRAPLHTQKLLLPGSEDVPEDSEELLKLKGDSEVLNLLLVRLSFDDAASAELLLHAWRGEVQDVERCLKARACPDHRSEEDGRTALLSASLQGHLEVAKLLCTAGAAVDPEGDGASPMLAAAMQGRLEMVKFLAEARAAIDRPTANDTTPLHVASLQGHLDVVTYLCESGAMCDRTTPGGATPLYVSCYNGHLPIVQYLVSQQADACKRTPAGATLLHAAAQEGQLEVVAFLCNMSQVDKDAQMHDGATPLLAAALQGHVEVVQHLTQVKADIHKTTKDGASALHACARSGHVDVARFLCEAGADKDRAMMEGATPLLAAALQGHTKVVKYLCEAGADKDRTICDGVTAFHAAAERGHAEVIQCLCEVGANKNQAMRNGLTPLMAACLQGHEEVVKVLCQNGVVMETSMREDLVLASVLLKEKQPCSQIFLCDPLPSKDKKVHASESSAPNGKQGATSLHVAALHGHLGVVKELCEARANLEAQMRVKVFASYSLSGRPLNPFDFSIAEPEAVQNLCQRIYATTGIVTHQQRLLLEDGQVLRMRSGAWEPRGSLHEICPSLLSLLSAEKTCQDLDLGS
ncbi:unnamed protein product [Cladocopium goreaui]|uniref:Ubiquitin-like domain-containing protein n=1 Tax=Cladocopium goreaui TaxID=2562237 RepID=A0A9P1CI14_9DINO|nr:unnamed protein product [Cladocopium goreaui]